MFLSMIVVVAEINSIAAAPNFHVPPSSLHPKFTAYAHGLLAAAKKAHEAKPKDVELAWKLGQAYFFAGEFTTNKTDRARVAERGIAACQIAFASAPKSAEVNYYYALNQGQLARTKLFAALGLVRKMQTKLVFAASTSPKLNHAGPDRCLTQLYRDAPGWPISVGNKKKARAHIAKIKQHAPEYPENICVWLETWIKWKDRATLAQDLPKAAPALAAAKKKLTGREWEPYWDDWDRRWAIIQCKATKLLPKQTK